ncbi:unnamed protein product [Cuscuta campestris]|uniref:Fungal lipase-like domain-containing protein n=1 Tax=Cuscuta campestris TaxID=132261 RepID=A0A484NFJ8_9ASTE|nr:unnamed protein product [Cuscuta campestris]
MSVACGVECVFVLGCFRWAWKRCTYTGNDDSAAWPDATREEFDPVPRVCRIILAVYEEDLRKPKFPPPGGYRLNPDWVIKRVTYEETLGNAPPYLIYLDRDHGEIVLAIRGLNLARESDYKVLLNNSLGKQMFDGGYVHHGLLTSAKWLLNRESETLRKLWEENGRRFKMVFAGHSLGSGVASLLTVILVNHRQEFGGIPRDLIACYAVAPARCMSLNLAVKYADVIHSVVLQDDFLPRTATPLEDIFKSIFCLPCLLFLVCLRDTFIPEDRKLRDPRRLYAPGRMYHIVERKFCRCGRFPPQVRTAIPVDGRFEHIVLSCHATSDHGIIWISRESEMALERLKAVSAETVVTTPPQVQKMERLQTIKKEHKDALERAVSLNIPHAASATEEEQGEESSGNHNKQSSEGTAMISISADASSSSSEEEGVKGGGKEGGDDSKTRARTNWDELVEKLFKKDDNGKMQLKRDVVY